MTVDELAKLRLQIEHWERIFDTVIDGIVIVDTDGHFTFANPGVERVLGMPRAEIVRRSYHDPAWKFLTPEGEAIPEERLPFARAIQQREEISGLELAIQHRDGERRVVLINSAPLYDGRNGLEGMICVFTDITATYTLQKQRDDYLHMLSHDLRIPLTIIRGHTQLVREHLEGRARIEWSQSVAAIEESSRRMNLMIEEMVEAARLEGGQLVLEKESLRLDRFVDGMLRGAEPAFAAARVETAIPADLPPVAADPGHLYRILANLLTNALKFSPPDTPVQIESRPGERGEVWTTVRDRGPGIAAEDLPRVFVRFFRADKVRERTGMGLGLYITRLLVKAQGGRIWVKSRPGRGSSFTFTLPQA